ncbi:MAG: fibronectin type III domain-containing protein [bacterium]|nr:fibronectin type III domain-containing protein [Candidatus Kapabacteria bacterium]
MKVRNLMLTSAFALAGILAACNENPVVEPGNGPTNLKASSRSATEVSLTWDAVSNATGYEVSWVAVGATGTGSLSGVSSLTAVATSLSEGVIYDFTVRATTASGLGDATTIRWAPASRATETSNSGVKLIRMYEYASTSESGLNLNVNGSPYRVTLNMSRTEPNKAQLAMFVYHKPLTPNVIDSIIIGPAYGVPEYAASNDPTLSRVDTTVVISSTTYPVASLDSWFLTQPLTGMIDANSNTYAYKFTSNSTSSGQGFVVRHGLPGAYHYARVLVKNLSGFLVGGATPNRYVELEISYQKVVNVPYAKRAPITGGVKATPGHRIQL